MKPIPITLWFHDVAQLVRLYWSMQFAFLVFNTCVPLKESMNHPVNSSPFRHFHWVASLVLACSCLSALRILVDQYWFYHQSHILTPQKRLIIFNWFSSINCASSKCKLEVIPGFFLRLAIMLAFFRFSFDITIRHLVFWIAPRNHKTEGTLAPSHLSTFQLLPAQMDHYQRWQELPLLPISNSRETEYSYGLLSWRVYPRRGESHRRARWIFERPSIQ